MKVAVTVPELARGNIYYNDNGTSEFIPPNIPNFSISAIDDSGSKITELPSSVSFGPDLYNLLMHTLPGIAARKNENLKYAARVVFPDVGPTDKYAYYGFGRPMQYGSFVANGMNVVGYKPNPNAAQEPYISLIGFGTESTPPAVRFGKNIRGIPNFQYSRKIEDINQPFYNLDKSQVLTNILNGPLDFSPLFGPLFHYVDPLYPKEHAVPWPTDRWIPKTGKRRVIRPNANALKKVHIVKVLGPADKVQNLDPEKKQYVPVPYVMSLPIYNMKHAFWREDPEHALENIGDPSDPNEIKRWGLASTYADYTGATHISKGERNFGEPLSLDYLANFVTRTSKPGYLTKSPGYKDKVLALWDAVYKPKTALEKEKIEKDKTVEKYHTDLVNEKHKKFISDVTQDYKNTRNIDKRRLMTSFIYNRLIKDPSRTIGLISKLPELSDFFGTKGFTKDMMNSVKQFYNKRPLEAYARYDSLQDDDARILAILMDYVQDKRKSQNNIVDAVKDVGR